MSSNPDNFFMTKKKIEGADEILKQFGDHLRFIRISKNLTQEDLAELAGFSRSYYTEIETGKRNISLLNLYKLARFLEISLKDLLNFE